VSVIRSDGRILGFEVETGSNNTTNVLAKVDRLNEACSKTKGKEWYFVVPSALAKKYTEYHPMTVTRGTISSLLSEFAGDDENKPKQ